MTTLDRFFDFAAAIPAFLAENVTPGAAVAAYDRAGELFCRGFGSRDAAGRLPVDGDTRFAYASISKTMTALTAAALVQRGALAWETRVRELLSTFSLADSWASERCTLRDLFLHRSGLPACDLIFWRRPISPADALRIVAATPHAAEFRTAFQYQNLNFGVIALMLQAATGKDWHALVREILFEPLGLVSLATTTADLTRDDNYARPCGPNGFTPVRELPFMELYALAPAGAVSGSVRDLARYGQMMLRDGAGVIPPAAVAECTRPQVVNATEVWPELLFYGQGLGWITQVYRGEICWSSAGGMDGYTSHIYVLPRRGVTAAALCNRTSACPAQALALEALDRAAGLAPGDWLTRYTEQKRGFRIAAARRLAEKRTHLAPACARPLTEYAGCYEHPAFGDLIVTVLDGELHVRYYSFDAVARPYGGDAFALFDADDLLEMDVTFAGEGRIEQAALPLCHDLPPIVFTRR
jgi:CubicO group peptidase (beta-lactamase class C family)